MHLKNKQQKASPSRLLFFVLFIALANACGLKTNKVQSTHLTYSYINSADSAIHWIGRPSYKKIEEAHSGPTVSCIDKEHPYGLGFKSIINELPDTSVNRVVVSAWINCPDTAGVTANLVFSIQSGSKTITWYGYSIEKRNTITPKQWIPIRCEFALPNGLSGKEELAVYFWNTAAPPVWVDDMEIAFER